jgi:hypothetical protein
MQILTVSKAKTGFSKVARKVIRNRKPVIVRTPAGFVQIAPYDIPEEVAPWPLGTVKLTAEERELHNHFGETL